MSGLDLLSKLVENLSDYEFFYDFMNNYKHQILETYSYLKPVVSRELDIVIKSLYRAYRRFNYPLDTIVVPCVKFCKRPIIKWRELQDKDPHDVECIRLRSLCSKLGNLINVMFLLNGFVVIDIDVDYPVPSSLKDYVKVRGIIRERKEAIYKKLKDIVDVETRRGYQIIRYIGVGNALYVKYSNVKDSRPLFWTKIHCPNSFCTVEIRSGFNLLGMFPEVSHYLDVEHGKLVARKYRALSTIARQFAYSNITDLMTVKVEELKELIFTILERLDAHVCSSLRKNIEIGIASREQYYKYVNNSSVNFRDLDYKHVNYTVGTLTYDQFKLLLSKVKSKLPNCVRKIFFERVEHGYCYALGRLACTLLFKFVKATKEEVEKIAEEFRERFVSFKRSNLYYWYYYCFSKKPTEEGIGYPTCYGIGQDVFMIIREYVECDKCRYSDRCLYYNLYVHNKRAGLKPEDIVASLIS